MCKNALLHTFFLLVIIHIGRWSCVGAGKSRYFIIKSCMSQNKNRRPCIHFRKSTSRYWHMPKHLEILTPSRIRRMKRTNHSSVIFFSQHYPLILWHFKFNSMFFIRNPYIPRWHHTVKPAENNEELDSLNDHKARTGEEEQEQE